MSLTVANSTSSWTWLDRADSLLSYVQLWGLRSSIRDGLVVHARVWLCRSKVICMKMAIRMITHAYLHRPTSCTTVKLIPNQHVGLRLNQMQMSWRALYITRMVLRGYPVKFLGRIRNRRSTGLRLWSYDGRREALLHACVCKNISPVKFFSWKSGVGVRIWICKTSTSWKLLH